jgi:hypothetical protein
MQNASITAATADTITARQGPAAADKPLKLTIQEELFIFCSLMLLTCYFLPWTGNSTLWDFLSESISTSAALFWIGLLALYCITPLSVLRPRARPWFGIVTAIATAYVLLGFAFPGRGAYGAELAKPFMLAVLALSASDGLSKAGNLAMRRLNSRSAELMTHWGAVVPGIHFSTQEIYNRIETEVRDRNWPGVEFLRVLHSEAGLLSHKREYLRVIRQRQVFDVCAAPFGRDYFFSLREAEIKAEVTLATLIIFLMLLAAFFVFTVNIFGLFSGGLAFAVLIFVATFFLFNVLGMGLTRLDGILMRVPVVGPIYETWFRRSTTYFQHDARMVFLKLVDDLIKAYVDEETGAKGVKLLSCFEHQPILDGIYKTSTRVPKAGKSE